MCSIDGCPKPILARGLCSAHYMKWKKYGDPSVVKQAQIHGKTLTERLEQYTKKTSECWLWVGNQDPNGYGRLNVRGKPMLAHRLWWASANGDPGKMHVLHKCDNPQCVKPEHLFLGTQTDNLKDMHNKKRGRQGHMFGEDHGMAKLTEQQVREIRHSRDTVTALSKAYFVSKTNISDIRSGKTWKHIKETT